MSDNNNKLTPADARTVLPGQPVTYHVTDPEAIRRLETGMREPASACPFSLASPIPAQPDPAAVVGVVTHAPQSATAYPPVPEPGFYWARIRGADRWEPVEVYEVRAGDRRVDSIGLEANQTVLQWGPKLEPSR